MNTLLPESSYLLSAERLDDRRLGKQRADVIHILKALLEEAPADGDEHPAIKMWRGNEWSLIDYGLAICMEWASRGNVDNSAKKIQAFRSKFEKTGPPEWLVNEDGSSNEELHNAHRSFLLRSQPSHYRRFWKDLGDDLPMVWPRTPEKQRASAEEKERAKLISRARKLKERADAARTEAHDAAVKAGLDPDTLTPIEDIEVDPELEAL